MGGEIVQSISRAVWALARRQHGAVARWQLLELGVNSRAIEHRLASGRLHRTPWNGVYAVGRAELTREGLWMAAVLACGRGAVLSHTTACALFGLVKRAVGFEVSVPVTAKPRRRGIRVHRRANLLPSMTTSHRGIPVTNVVCTLVDVAPQLSRDELEAAVNEADRLDLVDPETLRLSLACYFGRPGVAVLREILDRRTFTLTDSALERAFRPLARRAGLTRPLSQVVVNGFRVDFYWPDLGLVVETDGLRYHRTPAQQARDRRRDQIHTASGLTTLRFTHAQIRYEPEYVVETMRRVARRLGQVVLG